MDREAGTGVKTLDRVISKAGIGSRTQARAWIAGGRVRVNGAVVRSPDQWVRVKKDRVTFDGKALEAPVLTYVLLYKPKGYVTTYKDPDGRPTVYDLIQEVPHYVGTVGRLDLDTSGLLLLTNDHELADRLTSPEYHVEKEYLVKASTVLSDDQLHRLRGGIELDDGLTRRARVERVRDSEKYTHLTITLTEGRNRHRMLEAVGSKVLKLVRVRFGPLRIDNLKIGAWRPLTVGEAAALRRLVKLDAHRKSQR